MHFAVYLIVDIHNYLCTHAHHIMRPIIRIPFSSLHFLTICVCNVDVHFKYNITFNGWVEICFRSSIRVSKQCADRNLTDFADVDLKHPQQQRGVANAFKNSAYLRRLKQTTELNTLHSLDEPEFCVWVVAVCYLCIHNDIHLAHTYANCTRFLSRRCVIKYLNFECSDHIVRIFDSSGLQECERLSHDVSHTYL